MASLNVKRMGVATGTPAPTGEYAVTVGRVVSLGGGGGAGGAAVRNVHEWFAPIALPARSVASPGTTTVYVALAASGAAGSNVSVSFARTSAPATAGLMRSVALAMGSLNLTDTVALRSTLVPCGACARIVGGVVSAGGGGGVSSLSTRSPASYAPRVTACVKPVARS